MRTTDKLQQKILREYEHGYNANRSKNLLFRSQQDIYAVKKNAEQLRSQIFRSVQRTIQATCVINEPDVTWEDEDNLWFLDADVIFNSKNVRIKGGFRCERTVKPEYAYLLE